MTGILVTACDSASGPRPDGHQPATHGAASSPRATPPAGRVPTFALTIRASRMPRNYVELPVASADLTQIVKVRGNVLAALAGQGAFFGEVYPAISTDDGGAWRIDGPRFYRAAADGAAVTTRLTVSRDGTLVAWGRGGSLVKTSHDLGRHWVEADFADGVEHAGVAGRRLVVRALGYVGDGAPFATRRYVSSDDGRTWHRGRKLPSVSY